MTERLKPCLFCRYAEPIAHDRAGKHFVLCPSCDAIGPPQLTRSAAVAAWNAAYDDAPPPPPDAVQRELADIQPGDTVACPAWGDGETAVVRSVEQVGDDRVAFFEPKGFWRTSQLRVTARAAGLLGGDHHG